MNSMGGGENRGGNKNRICYSFFCTAHFFKQYFQQNPSKHHFLKQTRNDKRV